MSETFEKQPETGGNYRPLAQRASLDQRGHRLLLLKASPRRPMAVTALAAGSLPGSKLYVPPRGPRYDSEAIAKQDWGPVEVSMQESDEELTLSTTGATARIALNPLRIGFADASGREFAVDDAELGMGAVETPEADVF